MWQSLLRNYLMGQAQQRMREAAMQAAGEAMQGRPATEDEAPPRAEPEIYHVGLVYALAIEAGDLVDRLKGMIKYNGAGFVAHEGGIEGRRTIVIEGGAGRSAAAHATEALISGHHPQWVISAGFAGALDERLKQGDILMADSITSTDGQRLAIDFKMPPGKGLHIGRLLTVDQVIRDPSEKRKLGKEHDALAVDMETLAVAEVCRREKVRFLSVRVIIDEVDRALPRDIDHMVNKKTTAGRLGAAAGAIMRRPGSVKDMWQLKEDALAASEKLATFLTTIIAQLPVQGRQPKSAE